MDNMGNDYINLSNKEIVYFYKDILLYYERESHAGYRTIISDKTKNNYNIQVIGKEETISIKEVYSENHLVYTNYKTNESLALIYHLRNAFAHSNLYSSKDNKLFIIFDYKDSVKRTKCTMYGVIAKDKLKALVKLIKNNRKQ